jgi:hypothetical protein
MHQVRSIKSFHLMQAIDTNLIVHDYTGTTSGNEHTITDLTLGIASPLNQLLSLLSIT